MFNSYDRDSNAKIKKIKKLSFVSNYRHPFKTIVLSKKNKKLFLNISILLTYLIYLSLSDTSIHKKINGTNFFER